MSARLVRLKSWLRSAFGRRRLETDMEEEIQFHLVARAADLMREGLNAREATRQARLEFGTVATYKDEMRHSLGLRWWDELWSDLRYATRILRKSPGFTAIAVGSLALAIGANTTIFSVANELLYQRLGVPHPEQLRLLEEIGDEHVAIHSFWGGGSGLPDGRRRFDTFTYPVYLQLKKQNQVLGDIFAFKELDKVNATVDGSAQAVSTELVSGNLYQQLGVRPALGRTILPSDDQAPGTGAVVMISDEFWAHYFGRSPRVIGKVITVNLAPVTIIGVNPPGFSGAKSVQSSPELFMPMSMIPLMKGGFGRDGSYLLATGFSWVQLMARAKPGFSMQRAQASLDVALNAATRGTMAVGKDETVPHLLVEDGSKGSNFLGEVYAKPLYVLLAMVAFVLLLACANMANLMLARASVRQREMGVRLALGAGRWRILRQVLTESLLLSVIGGALGLLLGYLARTTLPSLVAYGWDSVQIHVPFNWRVFAFTAGITIATGILFGIAPAWAATRAEIGTALKQGSRTATHPRKAWSGKAIVGFQVALSTLLVVGAGLFLRTLINLNSIDPGFRADHLLLFDVNPPNQRYPSPKDVALHMRLEDALRAVPGVEGVTLSDVPLLSGFMSNESFYVEGVPAKKSTDTEHSPVPDIDHVGSSFFSVMGIPLLAGRSFTAQDSETSQQVSVINQALARKYFANQNPIGKRFSDSGPGSADRKFTTIIGVSADSRYDTLRNDPPPLHFDLYRQMTEIGGATYMVRTRMNPEAIVSSLRAAVQRIDRDLPLMDVRTQQQQIDALTQQERVFACLTCGFGVLAVALACVGIYGIMAYTVAQRTNEIGIRLALGAERKQVRGIVLREASWLAVVGVVSGLIVALALGRLVKSMLYGLQPADPVSLAVAAALLLTVALIAGWIPALRASLVEPMEALRHE